MCSSDSPSNANGETPDDELDMDVRSVAVIWHDDETIEISFAGCSPFEAIGLMHVGIRKLDDYALLDGDEDDGGD